jgi:hypothetical protein
MKRLMAVVAVSVAILSGCASGTSSGVSPKAARALASYVQDVRTAASGASEQAVRDAVRALDTEVEKLVGQGLLTSQRAQQIEDQADVVLSDFSRVNSSPSPSPTPSSPSPSPEPSSPSPTPTVTVTTTITPTQTATTTSTASP